MTLPLWIVLVLPFAKILATSLSIGSGGSGGIFGPGMVIGGFLGGAVWRVAHDLPAVPHSPAPFVVVGMIACFGSIAHAPLAVMLMVAEMTGTLEMLAPAMVAVGLASVIVGDATIYENQLRDRTESPAQRFRFGMPLIASLPVTDAMRAPTLVLRSDALPADARKRLVEARVDAAPVSDVSGIYRGVTSVGELSAADPDATLAAVVMSGRAVPDDASLDAVVEVFSTDHVTWVPVLNDQRQVIGVVSTADLIAAYRRSLASSLRNLRSIFPASTLIESRVEDGSTVAGRTVGDANWPVGAAIISIARGEQLIIPEPTTQIQIGDVLSVLAPPDTWNSLRADLGMPAEEPSPEASEDEPMI